MKGIDRSVARWYEELERYDFMVPYRKENKRSNADALSRITIVAETDGVMVGTIFLSGSTKHYRRSTQSTNPDTAIVYERFQGPSYNLTAKEMVLSSMAARRIWQDWSKNTQSPKHPVVAGLLIQTVLRESHNTRTTAIHACRVFRQKSGYRHHGHITTHQEEEPLYSDYFKKVDRAEPMKSQEAEAVPESVHSNQGPTFESRLFTALRKAYRISETCTTPEQSQGN
ncbi:unnamed protein product [Taenia asiatica]|uniref:Integrase n=1 Tax=Taenia asiatica TaxID=60517 RepID=A0A0R3WGH4_TAEAS|nr:unnamed protein product [Taenia asiatica]